MASGRRVGALPTSGTATIASDGTNPSETVTIASVTGNTVTISGTLAHAHNSGSVVYGANYQFHVNDPNGNVICDTGSVAANVPTMVWRDAGFNVSSNALRRFTVNVVAGSNLIGGAIPGGVFFEYF